MKIGSEEFIPTAEVPRECGRIVLAHGEVTGHAHAIASSDAVLYETTDAEAVALGTRILSAKAPVSLEHEEHDKIEIPRGEWGVRIQRTYSPEQVRDVAD